MSAIIWTIAPYRKFKRPNLIPRPNPFSSEAAVTARTQTLRCLEEGAKPKRSLTVSGSELAVATAS